jgi:hypothetical protein
MKIRKDFATRLENLNKVKRSIKVVIRSEQLLVQTATLSRIGFKRGSFIKERGIERGKKSKEIHSIR